MDQPLKPTMKDQVSLLRVLQDLDKQIFRWNKDRMQKPKALDAVEKDVSAKRGEHDAKVKAAKDAKLEVEKRELELKEREERRKRLEGQRDQSKSNKEYQGYNFEIAAIKTESGKVEEEVLRLMSSVEEATKISGESKAVLDVSAAKHAEAKSAVDAELAKIDAELKSLRDRRLAATASLDPDFLKMYDRIHKAKADAVALAPAVKVGDGFHCGGCRMEITFQDINTVMKAKEPVQCRSCGRILYLEVKAEPAPAK
ncbi:MAG: hypothetical protein K8T20_18705 [Planctomycetes bacterium]|nr:hypothetical protein [Planctomycetota bacterium]